MLSLFGGEILFIFLDSFNVNSSVNTVPKFISDIDTKYTAELVIPSLLSGMNFYDLISELH